MSAIIALLHIGRQQAGGGLLSIGAGASDAEAGTESFFEMIKQAKENAELRANETQAQALEDVVIENLLQYKPEVGMPPLMQVTPTQMAEFLAFADKFIKENGLPDSLESLLEAYHNATGNEIASQDAVTFFPEFLTIAEDRQELMDHGFIHAKFDLPTEEVPIASQAAEGVLADTAEMDQSYEMDASLPWLVFWTPEMARAQIEQLPASPVALTRASMAPADLSTTQFGEVANVPSQGSQGPVVSPGAFAELLPWQTPPVNMAVAAMRSSQVAGNNTMQSPVSVGGGTPVATNMEAITSAAMPSVAAADAPLAEGAFSGGALDSGYPVPMAKPDTPVTAANIAVTQAADAANADMVAMIRQLARQQEPSGAIVAPAAVAGDAAMPAMPLNGSEFDIGATQPVAGLATNAAGQPAAMGMTPATPAPMMQQAGAIDAASLPEQLPEGGDAIMPAGSGAKTGDGSGDLQAASGRSGDAARQGFPSASEQVQVNIRRAMQEGMDRIQVRLEPAELGRVDVRIDMHRDGNSQLFITADRQETLDMLRQDARELQRALQQAGIRADSQDLHFDLREQGQQFAGQQNNDGKESALGGDVADGRGGADAEAAGTETNGYAGTVNTGGLNIVI